MSSVHEMDCNCNVRLMDTQNSRCVSETKFGLM